MTKMQRVDLYGSAWQCADPAVRCPTIYGLVQRDYSTVTGIRVGVTATSASTQFNSHAVVFDQDAVVVPRQFDEPFYAGADPSLAQRTAQLHGTGRAWSLVHAD